MNAQPTLSARGDKRRVQRHEMMEFARRLAAQMSEKELSASELARRIWGDMRTSSGARAARNRDRIGNYLKAESYPERKTLAQIAKALEISVDDLAPQIPATAFDQENPELNLTLIAGNRDRVIVNVNILTSLEIALEFAALVKRSKGSNASHHEENSNLVAEQA